MGETLEQLLAQAKRYSAINERCSKGDYPPEAFSWKCDTKDISGINKVALAAETSRFVKENIGKVPELTPAPRMDFPFKYESQLAGCIIEASMKSSFVREMQTWFETNGPKIMRMKQMRENARRFM